MQSIIQRIKSLPGPDRIYWLSLVLTLIAIGFRTFWRELFPWFQEGLFAAALASFGFAFIWHWATRIGSIVTKPVVRFLLIPMHAIFLAISAAIASYSVANALGLPPHDFGLTLGLFTLLLYPLVWILITSALIAALALLFQIAFFCKLITRAGIKSELASLKHMAGAIGVLFLAGFVFDWILPSESTVHSGIRLFAYVSDYQVLKHYPGPYSNKRIKLHENGVVSSASMPSWGKVEINVFAHESK